MHLHHPTISQRITSKRTSKIEETGFLNGDGIESASAISDTNSNYEEQICINGVTVTSMSRNKITIPISRCSNLKTAETKALIDSGAEGKFVDGTIVKWKNVIRLKKPITVRNVDGTHNEMGKIRYKTKICYNVKQNQFEDWFYITKLGDQKVILGLPWLKQVNPEINWSTGTVSFPEERSINDDPEGEELEDDETDAYIRIILKEEELDVDANEDLETDHLWIQAKTSASQALAHEYEDNTKKAALPPEYAKWRKVFDNRRRNDFRFCVPGTTQLN